MSGQILILEDDVVLAEMIKYLLEAKGFEVKTVETVSQALELAPRIQPRLMLIDIALPDGNGLDLLERLRRDPRMAGLRVFVMSTQKSKAMRERAEALGALSFWAKPFEPQAIIGDVERAAAMP